MYAERRRKRSNFAGLALQYWLSSVARQQGIFGLVLADSAGLLVASSLRGPEAEELAAIAPLLAADGDRGESTFQPEDLPIVVHRTEVDRSQLFLCAVGDSERVQQGMSTAAGGVQRILTTH